MVRCSMWVGALAASVVLVGAASAAEVVSGGTVKSINAEKKEFVLTDSANKDWKFKLGATVVINRGGKETNSDLKAGDPVYVFYDKGLVTWTAEYVLVQEGDTKNCELMSGAVKSYDAEKKQLTFTTDGKTLSYSMDEAKVWVAKKEIKAADLKIGDHVLAIVDKVAGKEVLKSLIVTRR